METVMGNSNKNDFLQPLLDLMNKRMDGIEQKLDDTTNDIKSDVADLKKDVADLQKPSVKVGGSKFTLSPNVIYLLALGFVLLLLVIASILHVNLGGLLK